MRSLRRAAGATVLGAALAATGCTSTSDAAAFQPSVRWTTCPAAIESGFITAHRCGVLTVLEDRSRVDGPRLHLVFVRVPPVSGPVLPGLMTSFGGDAGDPAGLNSDASTQAVRLHHVDLRLETRGTGPGSAGDPSLRCPEVAALRTRAVAAPSGDPELTSAFVAAVGRCATRLRAAGLDLARFGAADQAADVEDLRRALGVRRWAVVGTWGTQSRTLADYLRSDGRHVGVAFTDSPAPEVDALTAGVISTRAALGALFATCTAQPRCRRDAPHLDRLWQSALDRLGARPLHGTATGPAGAPVPVLVDAGRLLRTARYVLAGDGPGNVAAFPSMVADAAQGRLSPALASLVAHDDVFCAGYRPVCKPDASIGVFLTSFCRDELPGVDRTALADAVGEDPAYRAVFLDDPYLAACRAWRAGAAPARERTAVRTGVPLLLLVGGLDSFTSQPAALATAGGLPHAWVLTVAGQTHNVLGFADCAITARNDWVAHPAGPPDPTVCATLPAPALR